MFYRPVRCLWRPPQRFFRRRVSEPRGGWQSESAPWAIASTTYFNIASVHDSGRAKIILTPLPLSRACLYVVARNWLSQHSLRGSCMLPPLRIHLGVQRPRSLVATMYYHNTAPLSYPPAPDGSRSYHVVFGHDHTSHIVLTCAFPSPTELAHHLSSLALCSHVQSPK